MPKVVNKFGVVTIVSQARAIEMVRDDGATLLNEPDMLPNDPTDDRSARNPVGRRISQPTEVEKQAIAAAKEEKRDADLEIRASRTISPETDTIENVEIDTNSATPEEALAAAEVSLKKKAGRPAKK